MNKGLCYRYADPTRDANAYYTAAEVMMELLPKCDDCGDPIQDEYFFRFDWNDMNICEDCLCKRLNILDEDMFDVVRNEHRVNTERWMNSWE